MARIALIIPYFGALPSYAPYFFESVRHASGLDVLLFADRPLSVPVPANVKCFPLTLPEFNKLASGALGIPVSVQRPFKVCDFKPTYGTVFAEHLRDYEFWGFGDIDTVWGDVRSFLDPLLDRCDIVSCRKGWISGSFCVLRNRPAVNAAYLGSADWRDALLSPHNQHFDELGGHLYRRILDGADLFALRDKVDSFTHVVRRLEREGSLRCAFSDLACEELGWRETLRYDSGRLTRCGDGSDVMYIHWVLMKRRFFDAPEVVAAPERFYIRKTGIYTEPQYRRTLCMREPARIARGGASGLARLIARLVS